jgi:hypothetical protein
VKQKFFIENVRSTPVVYLWKKKSFISLMKEVIANKMNGAEYFLAR